MLAGRFHELRRAYARDKRLYQLHLDLLTACDLDCQHCYLDERGKERQLPTAFWKDVITAAGELGVFAIQLSGGEITLRRDLLELIAHARAQGLFVHLKTHGGHVDEGMARALVELGVATVAVSYYSHRAETHDAITQRPGSHAATRAGIQALVQAGALVVVACTVMRDNAADVEGLAADCDALGVTLSLDGRLTPTHSGGTGPADEHGLAADELARVFAFDARRGQGEACAVEPRGDVAPGSGQGQGLAEGQAGGGVGGQAAAGGDAWSQEPLCVAGHLNLYVTATGLVTPCVSWPMPIGDLKRERLRDIWEGSPGLAKVRSYRRGQRSDCTGCALRHDCEHCPGQAWLERGDPLRSTPVLCTVAEARAAAARSVAAERPGEQE